jgi:hypothetical protein
LRSARRSPDDAPYFYTMYGLRIQSEIDLPLVRIDPPTATPIDVRIRVGQVPAPRSDQVYQQLDDGGWLFHLAQVADYYVRDGREITMQLHRHWNSFAPRRHLMASVIPLVLLERDILLLHGSAVRTTQGAVLFIGPSGAGKSTSASLLTKEGYSVITDDVCALTSDDDQRWWITQGYPYLKLSQSVLRCFFDRDLETLAPDIGTLANRKYNLPYPRPSQARHNVRHIFHLQPADGATAFRTETISGFDKIAYLSANLHKHKIALDIGSSQKRHVAVMTIAQAVPMHQLIRPRQYDHVDSQQLAQLVNQHLADC